MGFRLMQPAVDSPHATLEARAAHSVVVGEEFQPLLDGCRELSALATTDASGVVQLPYWAVLQLTLPLVGPDDLGAWRRRKLWAWLFDPAALEPAVRMVLASGACLISVDLADRWSS